MAGKRSQGIRKAKAQKPFRRGITVNPVSGEHRKQPVFCTARGGGERYAVVSLYRLTQIDQIRCNPKVINEYMKLRTSPWTS